MRKNKDTKVYGKAVVMVPYKKHHVPRYHEWMQSTELQQLTASEPLSLEEEYEMQQSWLNDDDKCTFIVLNADKFVGTKETEEDEIDAMIGDVNLFFNDLDDRTSAEVEIMIAEQSSRGKGRGKEALLSMFKYGQDILGVKTFTAKIGLSNEISQNMFKRLGFQEVSRSEVFEEVTLSLPVTQKFSEFLSQQTQHVKIVDSS